jgi:hypothetical protein
VTFDSLSDLTSAYSSDPKLAEELSRTLDRAEAAEERGKLKQEQKHLDHFVKILDTKRAEKAFTDAERETLTELVEEL